MTLSELEGTSEEGLRSRVNVCLAQASEAQTLDKPAHYIEAQFYLGEIHRRHEAKTVRRDLFLELIIIALIILELITGVEEIFATFNEGREQGNLISKQTKILENLQQSSQATVGTLTALNSSSVTMNEGIQRQLAVFIGVSVEVSFNQSLKRLDVGNKGFTDITVWGFKYAQNKARIEKAGRIIPRSGLYNVPAPTFEQEMSTLVPKGTAGFIPFELYIKDDKSTKLTVLGQFFVSWDGDQLKISTQSLSIKRGWLNS